MIQWYLIWFIGPHSSAAQKCLAGDREIGMLSDIAAFDNLKNKRNYIFSNSLVTEQH